MEFQARFSLSVRPWRKAYSYGVTAQWLESTTRNHATRIRSIDLRVDQGGREKENLACASTVAVSANALLTVLANPLAFRAIAFSYFGSVFKNRRAQLAILGSLAGTDQMTNWTQVGPTVITAFLASLVEFVEALTIVLAVGTVRGWRPALIGTGAGAVALVLLVGILGPALTSVPISVLQLVIGVLLLL